MKAVLFPSRAAKALPTINHVHCLYVRLILGIRADARRRAQFSLEALRTYKRLNTYVTQLDRAQSNYFLVPPRV